MNYDLSSCEDSPLEDNTYDNLYRVIQLVIIHMSNFKPRTIGKNSPTVGPPTGIETKLMDL